MARTTPLKLDRVRDNAPMAAAEAADYLGVGIDLLTRFEKEGLVTHRLGSGPKAQRRWYRSDLDEFVRRVSRNRCSPVAPGEDTAAALRRAGVA